MISRKGNVEVDVDGKKYGFRINTWAIKETCKITNCKSINELLVNMGLLTGELNIELYMLFVLECAKEYQHSEGKDVTVTLRDVYEWVDDLGGVVTSTKVIAEGLTQYLPKNSEAPETAGQMIEA